MPSADYTRLNDRVNALERALRLANRWNVSGNAAYTGGMHGHSLCVLGSSSADLSSLAFADSVSGANVTIKAGKFIVDGRGMYSVAETTVTVTGGTEGSPHWIIMRASRSSPSPTIVYQASPPDPASTTYYEFPLRNVYLDGATAVVKPQKWHIGSNIIVGAAI